MYTKGVYGSQNIVRMIMTYLFGICRDIISWRVEKVAAAIDRMPITRLLTPVAPVQCEQLKMEFIC